MKIFYLVVLAFLPTAFTVAGPSPTHELVKSYKKEILESKKTVEGWCSDEKALAMFHLVLFTAPETCVEIGVFGGSSILPTAMALRAHQKGVVYAIDPWANEECIKEQTGANQVWWDTVDMKYVYNSYLKMIKKHSLDPYVKTIVGTSEEAHTHIETIDILHIDGNHGEECVLQDVMLYYPKVKKGGYIWCDDIKWGIKNTDRPGLKGYQYLFDRCDRILTVDKGNCCLLRKR
jgi:cephalosporin hydroxylase